ncbi:Uncharacterised protein [uncultured archaeon]|nr:Uncharacterised protein [uncultured archaeon]
MIEALESRFKAEECSFRTIFGTLRGHRIYASRKVAEKIEIQNGNSLWNWRSFIKFIEDLFVKLTNELNTVIVDGNRHPCIENKLIR